MNHGKSFNHVAMNNGFTNAFITLQIYKLWTLLLSHPETDVLQYTQILLDSESKYRRKSTASQELEITTQQQQATGSDAAL
jgi:hypothetical protein